MTADGSRTTSLMDCLDRIEELIAAARRVPLTGNVVMHEGELLELLDHVRLELPDALKEADSVLGRREEILAEGTRQAEDITRSAQEEARQTEEAARARADALVSAHAVARDAEARAADMLSAAEARAAAVRAEADTYAREVMEGLEDQLMRTVATVRRGLETLPAVEKPRRRRRS